MQPFTACLSAVAQVNWLTNEGCFRPHLEFKVSTWPLFAIWNSFFSIINEALVQTWVPCLRQLSTSDDLFSRHLLIHYFHLCFPCCGVSLCLYRRKTRFVCDLKDDRKFHFRSKKLPKCLKSPVVTEWDRAVEKLEILYSQICYK